MQCINRYHRTAPCHNITILRQESVLLQGVIWSRCMESVIDAHGGVIYATGSLGRCLWNPKIRLTQVPAHTQNKDPYKYQESRYQCFVCCLCTHIEVMHVPGTRITDPYSYQITENTYPYQRHVPVSARYIDIPPVY